VNGGVCVAHGATWTRKRCSFEGCTNGVVKGGVCWTHGAKVEVKRCSQEGCSNFVVKGDLCWTHGSNAVDLALIQQVSWLYSTKKTVRNGGVDTKNHCARTTVHQEQSSNLR
jgi:hypothetical protein